MKQCYIKEAHCHAKHTDTSVPANSTEVASLQRVSPSSSVLYVKGEDGVLSLDTKGRGEREEGRREEGRGEREGKGEGRGEGCV